MPCATPLPNQYCNYGSKNIAGACNEPATHMVAGDMDVDKLRSDPHYKPTKAHLCCLHYALVMGAGAPCKMR